MIELVLQATLPVFLGVVLAAYVGRKWGFPAMWTTLGIVCATAVLLWGFQTSLGSIWERFLPAVAVYLPPLALSGLIFTMVGRAQLNSVLTGVLAFATAAANIFLAQFFIMLGCLGSLWDCP